MVRYARQLVRFSSNPCRSGTGTGPRVLCGVVDGRDVREILVATQGDILLAFWISGTIWGYAESALVIGPIVINSQAGEYLKTLEDIWEHWQQELKNDNGDDDV
ncbi:uncharacterized protein NECHADRAFT_84621 [Fusarium vanettenii 77-13-4]|uniref:Uncharacterized protein n=1 Tax=Fusarium vanettenii (strain ATCC MYA-4622 / CBS 123669 / FGSC 9596 / NRRL 45880 / 77-13-4) TaxID=660122 RepID=C7YTL2_FUSV7|nr:uncharacterized protein NECHADRAFT_84621 [Fusarium vanettenii 77-13-4]EEU44642.1 predicted protein [Fusarium vanettenii 77-13-4]